MYLVGGHGDNMTDEDKKEPLTNNIAMTIVSVIVMMVIVTSVALPILASVTGDAPPQISAMISIIPLLMIVGIVLFVVRQFSKSDR